MASIVIEVKDDENNDGEVFLNIKFDPIISSLNKEELTTAQHLALRMLSFAKNECEETEVVL